MKTTTIISLAIAALVPTIALTQSPAPSAAQPGVPAPPAPPAPARPDKERRPKEPVTWLGVETSSVPRALSEQLGLQKGFGVVVDYVVPEGPAAKAGLQQSDIIKMLNDQIMTGSHQLGTLVRSYADGTAITLTILRKGAEQKIQVTLAKRQVDARDRRHGFHFQNDGDENSWDLFGEKMDRWGEEFGEKFAENFEMLGERGEEFAERLSEDGIRGAVDAALRAADDARRQARKFRIMADEHGGMKATRIDLGKAELVFSDEQGELKLNTVNSKKMLTAKDAQGKLLFSGPVDTKEELDKVPADVRKRYDKLQDTHLPAVTPPTPPVAPIPPVPMFEDADDDDSVTQVSCPKSRSLAPVSWGRRNLHV